MVLNTAKIKSFGAALAFAIFNAHSREGPCGRFVPHPSLFNAATNM
jgi:hypothetical protein